MAHILLTLLHAVLFLLNNTKAKKKKTEEKNKNQEKKSNIQRKKYCTQYTKKHLEQICYVRFSKRSFIVDANTQRKKNIYDEKYMGIHKGDVRTHTYCVRSVFILLMYMFVCLFVCLYCVSATAFLLYQLNHFFTQTKTIT